MGNESQSNQSQNKPQPGQKPPSGQPSSGQQKPSNPSPNPRDNIPSSGKDSNRSAQRGTGGEENMDDESDVESNKSPGASDRDRSDSDRSQVR